VLAWSTPSVGKVTLGRVGPIQAAGSVTTNEWVDRLAPKAATVVALGTCATYGAIRR
jgi:Ni,Fe-hydrogenase I small subunit